jgi:PAS domain S-box-containing protein
VTVPLELQRLRTSVDLVPSLIAYVTPDEIYQVVNDAYTEWFGVQAQTLVGRPVRQVLGDEIYGRIKPHIDRAFAGEVASFTGPLPYKHGVRHISATYVPDRDAAGRVRGVVALVTDISELKQLEDELREQANATAAQRVQAEAAGRSAAFLSEASRVLAASLDHRATFAAVAELAADFFGDGCVIDVVDGGGFERLAAAHVSPARRPLLEELRRFNLAPRDGNRLWRAVRSQQSELLNDITPALVEEHALDEHHLALLTQLDPKACMIVPLVQGGRTLGVITLVKTGAERKYSSEDLRTAEELAYRAAIALSNARLYEQAQEASRLKDEFLAIVSHELRTPLNAMRGWTSLLRSMALDEDKRARALEVIDRNIAAQTQLVEDLLDISRIVSGRMRLTVQSVDLRAVIQAALDSARPAADAREIAVQSSLDADAGPILGDPDRLQQVVWNLLSNAIKFTSHKGRVELRLTRTASDVELSVADTGQGIEPEFLPHVFDRFRQGDSTTTRPVGGLGLGLAIVRHLVELHGGTVHAASPGPGLGATFTIRLPAMMLHRHQPREPESPVTMDDVVSRLDGVRVLYVDDDDESCEVLALVLKAAGADVRTVTSAAAAYEVVRDWVPDAIVSDIEMPDEDGYSLIQRIRVHEAPLGRRTVAIAATAYARREDRLRALGAGFQGHVAKPIEPAEIVTVLASLLGRVDV